MNHRKHVIPCLVAALVAMTLFATAGAYPLAAGVGLALLLCPIVMETVTWLLMRQPTSAVPADSVAEQEVHPQLAESNKHLSRNPFP